MTRTIGTLLTLLCLAVSAADAEVIRIEVRLRADLAGGMSFGLAGPYEKLVGTIYFAVDPDNPANQIITDIALAPRNADGLVEFHSDFFLIKPKDVEHATKHGFHLQLSGHTHGGQYFPFSLLVQMVHPFIKGLHKRDNTWVYINQGTGYWGPPLRIGTEPEITELTLTA